jgi:hypothetical protein
MYKDQSGHDVAIQPASCRINATRQQFGGFLILVHAEACRQTYLEKRFKIRPAGVVSKKDIGLRKIAKAMRSWSFRDAFGKAISLLAWN